MCYVAAETHNDTVMRQFEISVTGTVWPCCYYATVAKYPERTENGVDLSDHVLDKLKEEDPDWNNAAVRGLSKVTKHEVFWTHLWDEGFDSDNPPTLCAFYCTKKNNTEGGK